MCYANDLEEVDHLKATNYTKLIGIIIYMPLSSSNNLYASQKLKFEKLAYLQ